MSGDAANEGEKKPKKQKKRKAKRPVPRVPRGFRDLPPADLVERLDHVVRRLPALLALLLRDVLHGGLLLLHRGSD